MCGIAGLFGEACRRLSVGAMVHSQHHRGPDDEGIYRDPSGRSILGHNRLSILDLSSAGHQPMSSRDGRFWIVFNGEIYNYRELRSELSTYPFVSETDTEVILAAFERWGSRCLNRLLGMFAFLLWDSHKQCLFAARDRFGVKPLCYTRTPGGGLAVSSETRSLRAAGVITEPDTTAWATYLSEGLSDYSDRTFWKGVAWLPPGHQLAWQDGALRVEPWYDLAECVGTEVDARPCAQVQEEYVALLKESVMLRFRADVPVGINLSGGLDSSILLGVVQQVQGAGSDVKAFTFVTGHSAYDELPWVKQMLARTRHPHVVCCLTPDAVPGLASAVQRHEDAPFGGLPTLAYSSLFSHARASGVIVLLDGQGMDEQWAGYDYYDGGGADGRPMIQGTRDSPVRPECLIPEFRTLSEPLELPVVFPDRVRQLQYKDARYTKIPRVLRFNDAVSMQHSTELREPFLDHRLFELALRQPVDRKLRNGTRKWMLRQIAKQLVPAGVAEAPKRPVQTPQREWLRGPLRAWANQEIEHALAHVGGSWLDADTVRRVWREYLQGAGDTSFYIWQWVNLGLLMTQTEWRGLSPSASPGRAEGAHSEAIL
jgi:asparagine synthase (glutamine-hydrolysing)